MSVHCQDETIQKITKILGLPSGTKWFELRVAVNETVTVKAEYYPKIEENAREVLDTVKGKFKLVRIEEE